MGHLVERADVHCALGEMLHSTQHGSDDSQRSVQRRPWRPGDPRRPLSGRPGLLGLAVALTAALLLGALWAPLPAARALPATDVRPPAYAGFWPPESNGQETYRWTDGDSALQLYGLETAAAALVTLRLTGPQGPGAPPASLALAVDGRRLTEMQAPPSWRLYRLLVPVGGSGWHTSAVELAGSTHRAGPGDGRSIGVAVSFAEVSPAGGPAPRPILERAAFLALLAVGIALWLRLFLPARALIPAVAASLAAAAAAAYVAPLWLSWRLPVDWSLAGSVVAAAVAALGAREIGRASGRAALRLALSLMLAAAGQLLFARPGWTLLATALLLGGIAAACATLRSRVAPQAKPARLGPSRLDLALAAVLGAALLPAFLADLGAADAAHGDEWMWTTVGSRAFHTFFLERDLFGPFWGELYDTWGSYNPQVGKYLIGASLYLSGYTGKLEVSHAPIGDAGMMAAARLPSALLGVASCVLLYLVVTYAADRWHGLVAAALLAAGSLLPLMSRRAMVDAPALAFSMAALFGALVTLRAVQGRRDQALRLAAATGVVCGLAAAVKLNAGLIFGIAAAALVAQAALAARSGRARALLPLACAGVIGLWAWAVFFVSNPFLYPDPAGGVRHMQQFNAFVGGFSLSTPRIPQGKLRALWDSVGTYGPLGRLGLPGDQLLALVGLARFVLLVRRSPSAAWEYGLGLLALWGVLSYIVIGLWLPVDWDRYYLPLQPVNAALQAYGVLWVAASIRSVGGPRRKSSPQTSHVL